MENKETIKAFELDWHDPFERGGERYNAIYGEYVLEAYKYDANTWTSEVHTANMQHICLKISKEKTLIMAMRKAKEWVDNKNKKENKNPTVYDIMKDANDHLVKLVCENGVLSQKVRNRDAEIKKLKVENKELFEERVVDIITEGNRKFIRDLRDEKKETEKRCIYCKEGIAGLICRHPLKPDKTIPCNGNIKTCELDKKEETIPEGCHDCNHRILSDDCRWICVKKFKTFEVGTSIDTKTRHPDCPYKEDPENCNVCKYGIDRITTYRCKHPDMGNTVLRIGKVESIIKRPEHCIYNEKPLIKYKREIIDYDQDDIPDNNRQVLNIYNFRIKYQDGKWFKYTLNSRNIYYWEKLTENTKFTWQENHLNK